MDEDGKKTEGENCPNCGGPIAIRNPTGECDHLHYPENVPGYVSERTALLRCEDALRSLVAFVHETFEVESCREESDPDCPSCRAIALTDPARAALTLLDEARHGK